MHENNRPAGARAQGCRVDLHGPRVQTARRWRRTAGTRIPESPTHVQRQ